MAVSGISASQANLSGLHRKRAGGKETRLYSVWRGMMDRCLNARCAAWKDYGGRGILVSAPWLDYQAFCDDVGPHPGPEWTLERRDNNKGYAKGNVVWASRVKQARNRRNVKLTEADVLTARALHQNGLSCAELARQYRMTATGMRAALTGKTWADLAGAAVTSIKKQRRNERHDFPCNNPVSCKTLGELLRKHGVSLSPIPHGVRDQLAPPNRIGRHERTVGRRPTPLYHAWNGMLERCRRPTHRSFADYGARGITVCKRWQDFDSFCDDVGPHPGADYVLLRNNVNGHYEPGNARWGTRTEANRLRRPGRRPPTAAAL